MVWLQQCEYYRNRKHQVLDSLFHLCNRLLFLCGNFDWIEENKYSYCVFSLLFHTITPCEKCLENCMQNGNVCECMLFQIFKQHHKQWQLSFEYSRIYLLSHIYICKSVHKMNIYMVAVLFFFSFALTAALAFVWKFK